MSALAVGCVRILPLSYPFSVSRVGRDCRATAGTQHAVEQQLSERGDEKTFQVCRRFLFFRRIGGFASKRQHALGGITFLRDPPPLATYPRTSSRDRTVVGYQLRGSQLSNVRTRSPTSIAYNVRELTVARGADRPAPGADQFHKGCYANGRLPKKIDCAAAVSVVDEQLSAANSCTQPARAAITSENVVNVE